MCLYDSVVLYVPVIIWGLLGVGAGTEGDGTDLHGPHEADRARSLEDAGRRGSRRDTLRPLMEGTSSQHRDAVFLSECTWQAKRGVRTSDWEVASGVSTQASTRGTGSSSTTSGATRPNRPTSPASVRSWPVKMDAMLSEWLKERLDGRPDPMDEVVTAGLPAVRRLNDILIAVLDAEITPCVVVRCDGINLEP